MSHPVAKAVRRFNSQKKTHALYCHLQFFKKILENLQLSKKKIEGFSCFLNFFHVFPRASEVHQLQRAGSHIDVRPADVFAAPGKIPLA
jgi:hypothetical protein